VLTAEETREREGGKSEERRGDREGKRKKKVFSRVPALQIELVFSRAFFFEGISKRRGGERELDPGGKREKRKEKGGGECPDFSESSLSWRNAIIKNYIEYERKEGRKDKKVLPMKEKRGKRKEGGEER